MIKVLLLFVCARMHIKKWWSLNHIVTAAIWSLWHDSLKPAEIKFPVLSSRSPRVPDLLWRTWETSGTGPARHPSQNNKGRPHLFASLRNLPVYLAGKASRLHPMLAPNKPDKSFLKKSIFHLLYFYSYFSKWNLSHVHIFFTPDCFTGNVRVIDKKSL